MAIAQFRQPIDDVGLKPNRAAAQSGNRFWLVFRPLHPDVDFLPTDIHQLSDFCQTDEFYFLAGHEALTSYTLTILVGRNPLTNPAAVGLAATTMVNRRLSHPASARGRASDGSGSCK